MNAYKRELVQWGCRCYVFAMGRSNHLLDIGPYTVLYTITVCTLYSNSLSTVGETSSGKRCGSSKMGTVRTICYSCICTFGKKTALVQSINYQLCNLLSLQLNHVLQTNSHNTSELSICTLGDLNISSLT